MADLEILQKCDSLRDIYCAPFFTLPRTWHDDLPIAVLYFQSLTTCTVSVRASKSSSLSKKDYFFSKEDVLVKSKRVKMLCSVEFDL